MPYDQNNTITGGAQEASAQISGREDLITAMIAAYKRYGAYRDRPRFGGVLDAVLSHIYSQSNDLREAFDAGTEQAGDEATAYEWGARPPQSRDDAFAEYLRDHNRRSSKMEANDTK